MCVDSDQNFCLFKSIIQKLARHNYIKHNSSAHVDLLFLLLCASDKTEYLSQKLINFFFTLPIQSHARHAGN